MIDALSFDIGGLSAPHGKAWHAVLRSQERAPRCPTTSDPVIRCPLACRQRARRPHRPRRPAMMTRSSANGVDAASDSPRPNSSTYVGPASCARLIFRARASTDAIDAGGWGKQMKTKSRPGARLRTPCRPQIDEQPQPHLCLARVQHHHGQARSHHLAHSRPHSAEASSLRFLRQVVQASARSEEARQGTHDRR